MTLSRREGVDIRPTLLRVLTDLYVQASSHTADEEQQFVELTARLIDQVDDATRAAISGRLAIYPRTPAAIAKKLGLRPVAAGQPVPLASPIATDPRSSAHDQKSIPAPATQPIPGLTMVPDDAATLSDMFFSADPRERAIILDNLASAAFKTAPSIPRARAARAIHILEMAAFAADPENFILEIGEALILPARIAAQVVRDAGGESLACALKTLGMTSEAYQRILLFLDPEIGGSVATVYRLSRLYDRLSDRAALILLAAWRGAAIPTRAKYRPQLYDDERHRGRAPLSHARPDAQQRNPDMPAVPQYGPRRSSD